jgi:hypothetical protein
VINRPEDVYTGGDFEELVLQRRHPDTYSPDEPYVPFESALEEAKKTQGEDWDIQNPPTEIARRILGRMRQEIRTIKRELHPDLRFYRMVGSSFDRFHGADAVIEYHSVNGCFKVFIDFTINPTKANRMATVISLRDVCDGGIDTIATQMALNVLEQEKQRFLGEQSMQLNSDDTRL